MNKFKIDKDTIVFLYRKHRDYIMPIAIIVVSFLLIIKVILPQIENLSVRQQEVKVEKDKLDVLKNNLTTLNGISNDALDREVLLTTSALPIEKNFAGVLNAVTISANKAGVFLGDYEFQVGDLSKSATIGKNLPSLQLSLSVNGGVGGAIKFITELYRSLPLSEISDIEISNSRSVIVVLFYFKPFAGGASVSSSLPQISKNDSASLSQISTWNNGNTLELTLPVIPIASKSAVASPSATPSSPF